MLSIFIFAVSLKPKEELKSEKTKNKGFTKIIEAAIAIILLISIISILLSKKLTVSEYSIANYKLQIFNEISTLDEIGNLRKLVLENNTEKIKEAISSCYKINCKIVLFNETSNITEDLTSDELKENVASVSYIISGDVGNYVPREIRVYIWGMMK